MSGLRETWRQGEETRQRPSKVGEQKSLAREADNS